MICLYLTQNLTNGQHHMRISNYPQKQPHHHLTQATPPQLSISFPLQQIVCLRLQLQTHNDIESTYLSPGPHIYHCTIIYNHPHHIPLYHHLPLHHCRTNQSLSLSIVQYPLRHIALHTHHKPHLLKSTYNLIPHSIIDY